ncbi:hypothetical protein PENDEC_c008G02950 [Penicillium decumbens]|uniref:Uncharacterized protein n=1 Tax=Penicillium decumbens TaxID=69771 RepID=A0A1V6PEL5_PENDC|nr:hypothetical protein PENDEC_c008G02950 [Penicillium decumbens]
MFTRTFGVAVCLAATAYAVVTPTTLNSDLSILIHNDLQESSSPWSGSGVILLDAMPLVKATDACRIIGESLWATQSGFSNIQHDLEYLVFQRKFSGSQQYWIAPIQAVPSTIDAYGEIRESFSSIHLPVLCTQSAPYSTADTKDTNSTWQVAIQSNNENITG